jgi:bacteriocin biosynthesis cyclodehydratase domain-containing protein
VTSDDQDMTPLPPTLRLPPHHSVLRLGPGSRLLGLDPAAALAVDDLPHPLAEMLDELAAPVPTAQLVDRAVGRGADRGDAEHLLGELVAAGAVIDAAGPERLRRQRGESTVVVRGGGPLAVAVVLGLATAGVGAVHVDSSGVVRATDLGTGYVDADRGLDRSAATAAALARLLPAATTGPPSQRVVPDLVVLADASAPDPVAVMELHATRRAHLPVLMRDGRGIAGPLVLPGRSTCLGCLEVARCAGDPTWSAVAAQLAGTQGHAGPACIAATAGLATAQALVALDGLGGALSAAPPPTLDAVLELDVDAGTLIRRAWAPQSGCECGAWHAGNGLGGVGHGRATCADRRAQYTIEG